MPIGWKWSLFVWGYSLAWFIVNDWVKLHVYRHLELRGKHHRNFLDRLQTTLHPHHATVGVRR